MNQTDAAIAAKKRLADILADIDAYTRIANQDLTGWDRATASGMVIAKREAEDQLAVLKSAYKTFITNAIVKVFVTGARAADFAKSLDGEEVAVVNGAKLYYEVTKAVEPAVDPVRKTFMPGLLVIVVRALQQFMEKNNIRMINQPKLDANDLDSPINDFEALLDRVRKSIRNTNGDDLAVIDISNQVYESCLSKKIANTIIPVVITGLTEDEQQSLSKVLFAGMHNITIEATEDSTNQDLIKEINNQIRSLFTPKQQP
jgi:hypothetical protein